MACYRPRTLQRAKGGSVHFHDAPGDTGALVVPCRRCIGCRLDYGQDWSIRCQHEAQLWPVNSFVTLTYDDEHVPLNGSLHYRDVQLFLKRLRKQSADKVRFFCAGEYGEDTRRPHYHLLLFNRGFDRASQVGKRLFESNELSELWEAGHSSHGTVTPGSATYVARYSLKKVYGRLAAEEFYDGRVPEFCTMSRRPGLGSAWLERYCSDVLPRDYVVVGGRRYRVPSFYNRRFIEMKGEDEYGDVLEDREQSMLRRDPEGRSFERRADGEVIARSFAELKKGRGL